MNNFKIFFILILLNIGSLRTQSISLSGEIFEYATYYVNSFDFSTGATSVQIFRYELSSNQYPVSLKVRFKTTILSPALGITNEQTIIEIETDPFLLQAPLVLDNRDLSSEATVIFDMDTPPNQVDLDGNIIEILEPTQVDAILQSVMTTGQIADGEYSFEVIILSEDDQVLASDSKTFLVQSPVSVTLESPGGALSDTLDNMVYTTFPIFQWFSQPCGGCNTFIRVAQFNPQIHSSLEEAIEDQRVLPFDQSEYWYPIDNLNSFQYPPSDAYPLEEGNVYCWQVMVAMPTTLGSEEMASSISAFKIGQVGNVEERIRCLGKAGAKRWRGRRPHVRGAVMNPCDHPHGGGEGKAPIGHSGPMSPWGKPTLGFKTRNKKKQSNKFIVKRRK